MLNILGWDRRHQLYACNPFHRFPESQMTLDLCSLCRQTANQLDQARGKSLKQKQQSEIYRFVLLRLF